ncbi:PAS domain-containing protein [Salinimicrobium sp. MT39]|uniref:histidine kinase n=1 Tax=Salinimicrobium profundisediminis TaxID=2994553 RepID=A0A9X3CZE4_9FLAO|nr:PAS domain-containing protein [Salinimicrobium profundisediminis]MCX2839403.1 PAS domain-containing protein [Salinimicrobium profundisediminis]
MRENCWKEIFEAIPFACLVLEPQECSAFMMVEANTAYLELLGRSREDLLGKDSREIFSSNPNLSEYGPDSFFATLEKVIRLGEKEEVNDLRYDVENKVTGELEERYFSSQNFPIKNEAGKVEVILHCAREVTAENKRKKRDKEIEEELSLSRQQFKNFIRSNPDGLYRLDMQGNFLHVNESLAMMAGLPAEELIKSNFINFCTPHDQDLVIEHFERSRQGKVTSFEAEFLAATGNLVALKILLMPMFLEGSVAEVHGIAKDITQLKHSEKVIMEKSRFLEVNAAFVSSLLEKEINQEALQQTFGVIAETVEVDRMYYFEANSDPETGEILISQKVEWCSEKTIPQIDNKELQNMPIKKVQEITGPLVKNLPFTAILDELAPGELREIFIEQQIKSMLLLPVFVGDSLTGFVGFDDCTYQRIWKEEEITFLKGLTQNLTNAFERNAALKKAKQSEEELKLSEQKFRALVQEGADLIGILDIYGCYSFVSENYKKILGLDPQELIGKNAQYFIHPEDWPRVNQQFYQLKNQKQVKISPFRFKNKNGEYRWVQTTATNLLNDSAVKGIVANSLDITMVIEQAREIEHINERYQLAATATQDLIYDWDLVKNKVTRFHRGPQELFGYSAEAVDQYDFWRNNVHPEDKQAEKKKLAIVISNPNENFIKTEYRFRKADGTYARVVDRGYIIRDYTGKALRLIGATSDISEIITKREALKVANKRFKMAMKATNEMIWDWEIDTDSVTRSKGYKKIFGYDTNEATTVHAFWLRKVVDEDRGKVQRSLADAINNTGVKKWKLEYRFVKADGMIAHIIDRGYILRDSNGKATRMVGAVLDVTNSRRLLQKVQKQNKVLKEIAWEQSHVVRAPLARIKGLLHLLEEELFEEMSKKEILFHMKESANELDDIIRNIVEKTEKINVEAR